MPRERRQNGWLEKTGKQTKTWTGFWYVYIPQPDGKEKRLPRSKVLGPCSQLTKGAAQDALRTLIRGQQRPSTSATFKELAEWYLKTNEKRWSKEWNTTLRGVFSHQILPRLGTAIAAKVRKSEIQQALNDIANHDGVVASKSLVEKCVTHIRAVFEMAIDDGLLEQNPAAKVILPPTRKPSERFLKLDECKLLISVAGRRDNLILRLFILLGLRRRNFSHSAPTISFRASCALTRLS